MNITKSYTAPARRAARLVAVQSLYEMELSGKAVDQVLNEVARRRDYNDYENCEREDKLAWPPAETDMAFCSDLVRGVNANFNSIDDLITGAMAAGRAPRQLETVLRTILRVGTYELGQRHDIDPPVTISEFVGLAERFFSEREPALVNGLLDRIARDLRPDEMMGMHSDVGKG